MSNVYHTSVLLQACIDNLNIKPDGTYVDLTFGGGGHSAHILKQLGEKGKLFAFDQDTDAQKNVLKDKR
ncbi:MAG: 16S rRNA (cytosine(1402)-N(4))-methyltransferase, partial [Bacteroidia bacterium]